MISGLTAESSFGEVVYRKDDGFTSHNLRRSKSLGRRQEGEEKRREEEGEYKRSLLVLKRILG